MKPTLSPARNLLLFIPFNPDKIAAMKKSVKAALLSALVFPGAGHIYLKKYISAIVLFGVSAAGLYYMISKIMEIALQIVDKIGNGNVEPDVASIMDLVSKRTAEIGNGMHLFNIASTTIIICWLIGIIDSYRVGRIEDKKGTQSTSDG